MKSRFVIPLLAGATVVLLAANAFPTITRKHRLQRERNRLIRDLSGEQKRGRELSQKLDAIKHDRFYLQRVLAETWRGVPEGAIEWSPINESD